MAQPLWNPNKKMVLSAVSMLPLQRIKDNFTNDTNPKSEGAEAHDNGNCDSFGIQMSGNARRRPMQTRFKEALDILPLGIWPYCSTYASLLQECVNKKALSEGKLIHAHMIDTGFDSDIFLVTKLVIMYAKCGNLVDARRILDRMPDRNVVSWTAMIAADARHGYNEEAVTLFYEMQRTGIQPDQFTFASVLPAFANLTALSDGKQVHGGIINRGFEFDVFVGNALVDMYAKCGMIEDARKVFDKMPERDVVSWNTTTAGYVQNGHVVEALKLFQKMPERDVVTWNEMIAGYTQNGHADEAVKLFQKMPERDVVSWNAMITGYAQNGHVDEALKLFQKMSERDVVSWNAMVAGYAQNGHVDEGFKVFQKMPEQNGLSWNAMIAGYTQNRQFNESLKFFRHMQLRGMKPDPVTINSVLPACASLAVLKTGKEVHGNTIRSGFQFHISVNSALVDMYTKCGTLDSACRVFDKMPERDMVS